LSEGELDNTISNMNIKVYIVQGGIVHSFERKPLSLSLPRTLQPLLDEALSLPLVPFDPLQGFRHDERDCDSANQDDYHGFLADEEFGKTGEGP